MPGPLFSGSRASRRLRWPPEPSPAASLGDVGSVCRPRLAPALPAAPRLPPVTSAPRTITRPLERAVDAHTAGRGALSVDASASLLGWEHKCLDAAARPSTARCRSASPRMRCGYYWTGKLQQCFVLQERSKQFGLLHGSSRVEGCVHPRYNDSFDWNRRVLRHYFRVVDPRDVTNKPLLMNMGM